MEVNRIETITKYKDWFWELTLHEISAEEFTNRVVEDISLEVRGMDKHDALEHAIESSIKYIQGLGNIEVGAMEEISNEMLESIDDGKVIDSTDLTLRVNALRCRQLELDIELYSFNKLSSQFSELTKRLKELNKEKSDA